MAWLWRWGPVLGCMAAIFYESSQSRVPELPAGLSNHTGHFIAYGVFAACVLRALAANWSGVTMWTAAATVLIASAYGVTDEFHQRFVPGRFSGADDWLADTLGALAVAAIALPIARRKDLGSRFRTK
ncbi:MAG TPA: VanZ family protein [Vicinamibacterales bacterium]|nr:VanZ family protein [Vicinamibacterales bacterium]